MPSLSDLGQFKSSFNSIANEKADVESLHLPFDDLALPTKEAPPFHFDRNAPVPTGKEKPAQTADEPLTDDGTESAGGFDFGAFSMPDDISPPPVDDEIQSDGVAALDDFLNSLASDAQETPPDLGIDANAGTDDISAPDLGTPDDLLAGFSDEMESTPVDFGADDFNLEDTAPEEAAPEDTIPDETAFDETAFDETAFEETAFEETASEASAFEETAFEEAADDEDDFDGIDMGGESPHSDFSEPSDASELGEESAMDAGSFETEPQEEEDAGIDMGGESPDFVPSEAAGDDDFSMDGVLPDTGTGADFDSSALPDFDFGSSDSSDTGGSLPDLDLPDADADMGFGSPQSDAGADADFGSDFDSPALPDFDTGFDASADMDLSSPPAGGSSSADTSASLDLGDFGDDFASSSIDLENEPQDTGVSDLDGGHFGGDSLGSDDFALPGLDDILEKSKIPPMIQTSEKKGFFKRRKQKEQEEEFTDENIDEISLSQENVDSLLRTLAAYPLNLRIICEELIAEQVILPAQLSKLIRLLVSGAHVKETAAHVETITGKPVIIPKSFEKGSGAAFEAEQSSFAYIFMHNFLPVLKLFAFIAVMAASVLYLGYRFIYLPLKAESIYKRGYEIIPSGEYSRANELFDQAFAMHKKKKWFYLYAESFRDLRLYSLAVDKYDALLRNYPRDKKGVLDYANLNTYYIKNYEKANDLLQRQLLDFAPDDIDALLAAGDNFFLWADSDPSRYFSRYEDARFCYARVLELQGWETPVVQRMMKYFIRIDDLKNVLYLRDWFDGNAKHKISPEFRAELAGYLLDKQLEKPSGVSNPYVESIESVRNMLLETIDEDPNLPEAHYHLSRYHHNLGNVYDERLTIENAIRAFDLLKPEEETVKRRIYRVDSQYRYANILINNKEFFPAEEQAARGIELFEDYSDRNKMPVTPQLGQLYAVMGDLEYFVKSGNMRSALNDFYLKAEQYNYAPPEMLYRMGAAYYQLEEWSDALRYLENASSQLPFNRKILFALGNVNYQRGNYYAASGYYDRLLGILEEQRRRLPVLLPNDNPQFLDLGERLMMARNNAGVVNEALAEQTGNREYRSKALFLYNESANAWDSITRDPDSMNRLLPTDSPGAASVNLGYLNANNALRASGIYTPEIFVRIDKDVLEPSKWEQLAPGGL